MSEPLLCNPEQAAASLGIAKSKVWELIRTGEIPSVKIGKRRLIPTAELDRYVSTLLNPTTREQDA